MSAEQFKADPASNSAQCGRSSAADSSNRHRSAVLTNEEIQRYSRQLLVPSVGVQSQTRLQAAKVLVIGAGGLGCALLPYLAGAGVGSIGIVDFDVVDTSNLH
eukprot:13048-Heterococcus_DN1.PRE.1